MKIRFSSLRDIIKEELGKASFGPTLSSNADNDGYVWYQGKTYRVKKGQALPVGSSQTFPTKELAMAAAEAAGLTDDDIFPR